MPTIASRHGEAISFGPSPIALEMPALLLAMPFCVGYRYSVG